MRRVATSHSPAAARERIAACVNETEMRKRDIQDFLQTATGEYNNEAGEQLVMVPVYARMIGLDTMYLERTTRNGTTRTPAGARALTGRREDRAVLATCSRSRVSGAT